MKHKYFDVPKMGTVELSIHAQKRATSSGITELQIKNLLYGGEDTPDGIDITFRDYNGIRAVILLYPKPDKKRKLVKTIFKIELRESIR